MKSWKTSIAGLVGGLILTFGPTVGSRLSGDPVAPPITFQNYGPALLLAAVGLLSKDYDKTNAPVPAPTQSSSPPDDPSKAGTGAGTSNFPTTR